MCSAQEVKLTITKTLWSFPWEKAAVKTLKYFTDLDKFAYTSTCLNMVGANSPTQVFLNDVPNLKIKISFIFI